MNGEIREAKRSRALRGHGWIVELAGCAAVLGALAFLAMPGVEERREQARSLGCETIYTMLDDEVRRELDAILHGQPNRCGNTTGNLDVLYCTLQVYNHDSNPRNRSQTAYTDAGDISRNDSSCRVGLTTVGTNGIGFSQWVRPDSTTSRTFSVVIE